MIMPFGRYKDQHVHEIPSYYLKWALNNLQMDIHLKFAMQDGISKKEYNPHNIDHIVYVHEENHPQEPCGNGDGFLV